MDPLKNRKLILDLFEMYENEFRVLYSDHSALQLENEAIKLHLKNNLAAKRRKKMALSQETDKLRKKLQEVNSEGADEVTSVEVILQPGQKLEAKHLTEHQTLASELQMEKKNRAVLSQKVTELNHQLQVERDLRIRAEAKAGEAVHLADELMQKLEETRNISPEPPGRTQLDAELKTKVSHLEIEELDQIFQKEKELRAQAEAEKTDTAKVAEALCKDIEGMKRVMKASKRCSDNALQKLSTIEKSIEDMAKRYMVEKKEKECLQQEIVELLQGQNDLREQNESDSLRDFEILEALCQESVKLQKVSEKHAAERQTLATRLEMEEKRQGGLCHDILWLIQMIEKEMELRALEETDKLEAIEVGRQKIETYKMCSSPRKVKQGSLERQWHI
ncbi:myosin heavy chain, skeletal muscle-like [Lates japonicus]